MGEGKTHRAAQPVAHTAHRTNAARGPWRLLPGRLLGTAHRGLHEQKAVTGDREPTCFSRPSRPSGQFLAFVVEKNHTYRYFSNHRIYSANPIKETMAERGWGGVRYVCTSQILSHTHTPASGTQAPLSEPQAGAWPAEQGFRGHWITTNLSWLSPVHTLCPNSDRPLPDPHGCKQRGRGSPWGIVDPEGREGRSLSLPERDLTDS